MHNLVHVPSGYTKFVLNQKIILFQNTTQFPKVLITAVTLKRVHGHLRMDQGCC